VVARLKVSPDSSEIFEGQLVYASIVFFVPLFARWRLRPVSCGLGHDEHKEEPRSKPFHRPPSLYSWRHLSCMLKLDFFGKKIKRLDSEGCDSFSCNYFGNGLSRSIAGKINVANIASKLYSIEWLGLIKTLFYTIIPG